MRYEFEGCDNAKCPNNVDARKRGARKVIYVLEFSFGKAPAVGEKIPCPCPGCKTGMITRIFSPPNFYVKGSYELDQSHNKSYMTRINGQDTVVRFMDHVHTDPNYQRKLQAQATMAGMTGIQGAHYSPEHGRVVVSVESNRPDPLGAMKRSDEFKRTQSTENVKQPYKIRKISSKRPIERGPVKTNSYIPIRRRGQ